MTEWAMVVLKRVATRAMSLDALQMKIILRRWRRRLRRRLPRARHHPPHHLRRRKQSYWFHKA